ncbi:MAG: sigma-54-dependent Fis family transcriptional regulator [Nitrospirae bacterium]|nr:sigma-54-dependent Fis family transcriptional regulator [Nitrospirota bacterium]
MKNKGKIYLVDDDALIVSMVSRTLKKQGYEVLSETAHFRDIVTTIVLDRPEVVLLDIRLPETSGIDILEKIRERSPDIQVIMVTSDDTVETAVRCMKLGAVDYLTKPFNTDEVKLVIENVFEKIRLRNEVAYLRTLYAEHFDKEIIGNSDAIQHLRSDIEKIARVRVPSILITGESGTGKELVARCLHRLMNEKGGTPYAPFIAVNCSALPENLLESELFGYEKGAFTDARTEKKGLFEFANNGTILLDEIGEMRQDLQSKLLRVLEERTVRRIGGRNEIPIDVTVMTTTNKDIPDAAEKGEFRSDLFYRLNTFSIQIPPLRERRDDIVPIAEHYRALFAAQYKNKNLRSISAEAGELLQAYDWPGNVRELRNVIEKIVVMENGEVILPGHLPSSISRKTARTIVTQRFVLPAEGISLDDLEKDLIIQAIEKAEGNKTLAAKLLNITYDTLRYQIKKFGIDG